MYQWSRTIVLVSVFLLAGSIVHAADSSDLIPLVSDQSLQEATVSLAEKTATGLRLHLRSPYLEVTDRVNEGELYHLISIPGADAEGAAGEPTLPLITQLVAIPDGQTLRVKTVQTRDQLLDGAFRPWPAQGLRNATDKSFRLDEQVYRGQKRSAVPAQVTVGQPGLLRDVRVVPVRFRPATWSAGDGKLTVAAEIDAEFELVAATDGNRSVDDGRPVPQSFATIYANEVLGYEADAEVMSGPGTYLLIHPDNATVRANLDPLIAWRQRQGYNVVVASTAVTGTSTSSIKNYIQNQYNALSIPLEFVTLVGDANGSISIPTYIENLSGYGGEGDHQYTLLAGGDVLADVHIGRISVTSTTMLADMVAKIVNYESKPYMDDDLGWFTRAGLSGDPSSSGYSCIWVNQWVKEQLLDLNYTQIDTIWSGNFANQIYATISQGETIFTYRGYFGMSGVNSGYISAMNNNEKLPFALILTCDTGSFSRDDACRSEAFFRNPTGGAVAAIGTATIGTHTRYNNCMFQGVAEGVLNSADSRVGPGLSVGKLHLYQNYYDVEPDKVTIWSTWNNLIGDPATAVWTAVPAILTVDYPANLAAGANELPVTVTSGGQPQVGAQVTVFREGLLRVSGVTDADGRVNLPLSGLIDGEYLVTVTGRNLKPYLGGVNVGSVVAAVNFAAVAIDDDDVGASVGDGDGVANPGETVELTVDLTNLGTGGVNNVVADLISPLGQATVEQGASTYGFIASGATVSGQQRFVVDLAADLHGGTVVPLELVASDGVQTWNSLLNLTVSGPAVEVQRTIVSGGINPGQSADISIDLLNLGDLPSSGATGTLSTASNWVTVTDAVGSFGAIDVDRNATNSGDPFTISASTDCFPGHVVNLTLDLVYDEGGTASLPVLVTIGNAVSTDPAGPDRHGYYAFDNTDTDYAYASVYDWVEISPERGGQGVSVGLRDFGRWEDDVVVMDLPFAFTYYGETFTKMSVCSNGWVSMGATDQRLYRNWTLPSLGTPDNMIAVYWDDLHEQSGTSGIYAWYDAANYRLIIEWDNVANSVNSFVSETFQVILTDPAYSAGDTGDGIIKMNFKDINPTDAETGYGTVGIQNGDRDDAVLCTYYNLYPAGAATITDGSSVTYRTVIPQAQGTLRGTVSNLSNSAPIDGATVSVVGSGLSLISAADGKYQGGLTIGTYDIAVYHPSFAPDTTYGVVIEEALETVVDFALTDVAGPLFEMQVQPESTGDTSGPYDVVFKVTDYSGIQETRFYYTSSASGGPFELTPQADGAPDTWRVSIPGQPDGTLVQYWLTSIDQLAQTSSEPSGAPFDLHAFTVAQTAVIYGNDMQDAADWTAGLAGDTATSGIWTNVDPVGVFDNGTEVSPEDDHSDPGTMCWVTGQDEVGGSQGGNDVDGGMTTLISPLINIAGYDGLELQYHRWYTNDTGFSPGQDTWTVQVQAQSGDWINLEQTQVSERYWRQMNFQLADHAVLGNEVQFRFIASDLGEGSVVEAAVDDFVLSSTQQITDTAPPQVSLLSPNGGEILVPGALVDITWNQSDDTGVVQVEILLSTDGGVSFTQTIAAGPFNGAVGWTVPVMFGSTNRVKVICYDAQGNASEAVSAADFTIDSASAVGEVPVSRLALAQNSPNPFNPRTKIEFSLPSPQQVTLRIYNVEGRLMRTLLQGRQEAGVHTVVWSGKDELGNQAASGLYFYRLETAGGTLTRKMTLLK